MPKFSLTELEGATLAQIRESEPCTAYAIAECFSCSPSSWWSGSAGAIYPLVQRLHKNGLLTAKSSSTGKRKSKLFSLTSKGEAAFREWLLDAERAANPGFDPLRTRLIFLDAVSTRDRRRFLSRVEARLSDDATTLIDDPNTSSVMKRFHKSWLKYRLSWLTRLGRDFET